jgi:uncharacterized protein
VLIDISSIRKSAGASLKIDTAVDLSDYAPEFSDVKAEGEIRNTSGIVSIKLHMSGIYSSVCDRCGGDAVLSVEAGIDTVFDGEGSKDDSVTFTDGRVDLEKTVCDALVLAVPMQILCKEDCAGVEGDGYEIIYDEN